MSARAGIVVTGTEVLTGRVSDRNGPWLSDRLRELGVDLAHISIVGDRPQDMHAALDFMAEQGMDLVLTSGGLGPTADDLTAEVVGGFQGREMVLDEALERRIGEIVRPLMTRWPNLDVAAIELGTRKQATIPAGATVLEPIGTAPGLVVAPLQEAAGPTIVVLPGPPRELQPMWARGADGRAARGRARRDDLPPADAAPVRDPRVGDRRDAARRRTRGGGARSPGDNDVPETRRDRGRHAL